MRSSHKDFLSIEQIKLIVWRSIALNGERLQALQSLDSPPNCVASVVISKKNKFKHFFYFSTLTKKIFCFSQTLPDVERHSLKHSLNSHWAHTGHSLNSLKSTHWIRLTDFDSLEFESTESPNNSNPSGEQLIKQLVISSSDSSPYLLIVLPYCMCLHRAA